MARYWIIAIMILVSVNICNRNVPVAEGKIKENIEKERDKAWESLVWAICEVESGSDDGARSQVSSAAGRFQMLRGYVDDANRIRGSHEYTYDDRHDAKKAREMFEIVQAHYNPEKDIDKAITLHRGKYSKSYIDEVKHKMEERK